MDFDAGKGFVHFTHTCSVTNEYFPAWPVRLNGRVDGPIPLGLVQVPILTTQHTNDLDLKVVDGTLEASIFAIHGDRRTWAGIFPTDYARPQFGGLIKISEPQPRTFDVSYEGTCFPSLEFHGFRDGQPKEFMRLEEDAPSGTVWSQNCRRSSTFSR